MKSEKLTMNNLKSNVKKIRRMESLKTNLFCYALLIVPIIHWIILWLGVNAQSLVLPFQDEDTGRFTLKYFEIIIESFKAGGTLAIALKNTLIYFTASLITGCSGL